MSSRRFVCRLKPSNSNYDTPLHIAIMENVPGKFNLELNEHNVNAINLKGERPIHYAVLYNRLEFAKTLINNGAILEVKDVEGNTPLYLALEKQNVQIAEIFFKNGAVINEDHFKHAVRRGNLEVLKYLMKNGSKSEEMINKDELGLLQTITKEGRLPILKYLVDEGWKTETDNIFFNTISYKRYDMWEYLLTRMSKIHAKTYFSENHLHSAVRASNVETVRALVNEFEPDSFDSKLAVHIAVENGNEEILEVLLNAGYSIEGCFKVTSPLHIAATFQHTKLVKMLLKAGADVNSQTENGFTPLHFVATAGQPTVVKFLLESGADPSKTCNYNGTPLLMALKMCATYRCTISALFFEKLMNITETLILSSKNNNECKDLFFLAPNIRISSNFSSESTIKIPDGDIFQYIKNSEFRLELIRCIFNYLTNKEIERYSEYVINNHYLSNYTQELLHLMMEYNDSKSCGKIGIGGREADYKCRLLLVGYSTNDGILFTIKAKPHSSDSHYLHHRTVKADVLKLIVARLVLLMKSSHPRVLEYCQKNKVDDWREKCESEINRMQKMKLDSNLSITFYDILTKSVDKLATYTRNENFLEEMESSYVKFPAYADFLKTNVEVGKRRKDVINECVRFMHILVSKNHKIRISNDEIDQIFQYLSILDLRRFSAACS